MFRNQNFEQALRALKQGMVIARQGWNGKGMFAYYVPPASYQVQTGAARAYFGKSALVPYAGYFALKNNDGQVHVWVPSTGDLLAEDWITAKVEDVGDLTSIHEVC